MDTQIIVPPIQTSSQAPGTEPSPIADVAERGTGVPGAQTQFRGKEKKQKKKKLTKEERKALKLEKKRLRLLKIENAKKQIFYDNLTRELKFTKKSYVRGNPDWEQCCLDVEYPKAKLELKTAIQNLNRLLDVKDHTINRLKQDRQTADEQYRRNVQKHANIIEYLIKLFQLFVKVLKENYNSIAYQLIKDFHIEIRNKERVYNRSKLYYDNLLFGSNLLSINYLENRKREFLFKKQEKNEHKFMVVDSLHQQMLVLHNQIIIIMRELTEPKVSPNRLKLYDTLLLKKCQADEQFKKMTVDKRKIEKIITALKIDLSAMELRYSKNISDLKHEKRVFKANFEVLKTKYDRDMSNDQAQLRVLVSSAYEPVKHLEILEKFGQRIIGVAAVTRKYETEKEKVVPFYIENLDETFCESTAMGIENLDETIENMQLLQNFMYKVSKVEYDNRRLTDERDTLSKENELSRECLRRYCHEQTYNTIIASLRLNEKPTSVAIPTQEASQIVQIVNLKKND